MRAIHSPHGTMRSICARNFFLCVRTFANSSLNADIVICLSMRKLYHIFRNSAQIFFVRFCPKYGDSRITGPYNSLFKDIIKIKGGENNVLLIGTVNCAEIQQKRRDYPNELNEKKRAAWKGNKATHQDTRSVKGPPAGFYNRKEEHI